MNNLIVVLFSVYNKDDPHYFELALNSLLKQSYSNLIVMIGVDGLINDVLKKIVCRYVFNERVRVVWFEENRGLTAVLNDLLEKSMEYNPSYIARMDADDISSLDRFEKQVNFLNSHLDVDVVGGAIKEIDSLGNANGKIINYPLTHDECFSFFSYRNPLAHPAVMFRRSFFDKAGRYKLKYKKNQDTALWYDGFSHGCIFANIPDVVLFFRVSNDMYKRRGGVRYAKEVLKLRLEINEGLNYGWKANVFAYCYYFMAISPYCLKKILYKLLR